MTSRKHAWPVQDAKARFSELLETCLEYGPQVITKRGSEAAVLVSIKEWRQVRQAAKPSLKDLLLADSPRFELPMRSRRKWRFRPPPDVA